MANNLGIRTSVQVQGLESMRRALRDLPEKVQQRQLSASVAAGARVVLAKAKELVRVDTGLLQRMLRATRGKRRDSEASAFVTVRRLSKKAIAAYKSKTGKKGSTNREDPFYWSILEFGKSTRTAHPFIRPAFAEEKRNAATVIVNKLRAGIEKEAKALAWGSNPK